MSDLYRLATALRAADDGTLGLVVHERGLSLAEYKDFFDLANALLAPKSQALIVAGITNQMLASLRALVAEEKTTKEQLIQLAKEFLVWSAAEPGIYDWVKDRLSESSRTAALAIVTDNDTTTDQNSIDLDCGIHAFEAMQAITELIFDFDQHLVREVAKGAIGLPDVKRASAHLGKSKEYVKSIFELAKVSGLVSASEKRFQPTALADSWIAASPKARWIILCEAWSSLLGAAGAKELLTRLSQGPSRTLSELIQTSFPFATAAPASRINRLAEMADQLGLSSGGFAASWLPDVLSNKLAAAAKDLESRLPAQQERIIIQADLSIITPGPLASGVEVQLRKFADTENIGLASSYRISPLSISCGLEEGMTENQMRLLLQKLNGAGLPQPVDYLIRETAERFGRLKISSHERGSLLISSDELLAKQITMDSKLKSLMLEATPEGVVSPIDSQSLYHALRENGYLAVLVDERGKVIAPSSVHKSSNEAAVFLQQIERLRAQDVEMADSSPASDMERKILLALKTKSTLQVEISANGKLMKFLLEPIGIANGRLRARDRKADIERTLPVSAITSILIG
ncbi:unannotated protein [freshwater metagenome]|uniref:Unannotated protein n=1 Tax=freshwater metagenome TaxID=449393 RepID=A0A6J6J2S9_9ZZZZ|nr:hypothetical protein [Actinomycetota bacterium]